MSESITDTEDDKYIPTDKDKSLLHLVFGEPEKTYTENYLFWFFLILLIIILILIFCCYRKRTDD
jgi:hypothetical protein